jgi:hypothetical protein
MNEPPMDEAKRKQLADYKDCLRTTKRQWEEYRNAESIAFSELRTWAADIQDLFFQYRMLPVEVQNVLEDLAAEGQL